MEKLLVVMTSLALLLSGCALPIKDIPKFEIENGQVHPFSSDADISVVALKADDTIGKIEYYENDAVFKATYTADFDQINDMAVELLKDEIAKNGITISSDSKRILQFCANRARWSGGWVRKIYLDFEVETGDGYRQEYSTEGGSGSTLDRAMGDAITNAARKTLQDRRIVAYIQYGSSTYKEIGNEVQKLEELNQMKVKGLITEEEYQIKKMQILNRL